MGTKGKKKTAKHNSKDAVTNVGGRPTKYDPAFCQKLIDHMSEGGTLTSFAATIKVSRDTVYEWSKIHVQPGGFSDALKEGQALLEKWFEDLFKRMAVGQLPPRIKTETTVTGEDGKTTVTRTFETPTGNATAAIFMAQNMIHWRNRKDVALTGEGGGPVKYSDVTSERLKEIIKEGLEVLGIDTDVSD